MKLNLQVFGRVSIFLLLPFSLILSRLGSMCYAVSILLHLPNTGHFVDVCTRVEKNVYFVFSSYLIELSINVIWNHIKPR